MHDHGADAGIVRAKDQVHAAGVQLGIPKYGLAFKYLHEYLARDRFEGRGFTITFGLPLDPPIDRIAHALCVVTGAPSSPTTP